MKKALSAAILLTAASFFNAQVGINTPTPSSTLDITAKNSTGTSKNVDGLLVPRVDRERAQSMSSIPVSTLIFVDSVVRGTQTGNAVNVDTVGYYYFDGNVWVKLNAGSSGSSVNIYNSDGTVLTNRTVTQNDKTLTFTGTATNAFSVDGKTFSVDAANDRVGIGTMAPVAKLHVEGIESQFTNATSKWALSPEGTSPNSQLSLVDRNNNIRRIIMQENGNVFLGGNMGSVGANATISAVGGNVGIANTAPTNTLDVNGTARVRTVNSVADNVISTPVHADANGVFVKMNPGTYGSVIASSSPAITPGATATVISGLALGAIYKAVVSVSNWCTDVAIAEYYIYNGSYPTLTGDDGVVGTTGSKPTFTQASTVTTHTTWNPIGCQDGSNTTGFNYTISLVGGGTVNITNNGNIVKNYRIVLTRMN
ncbi:hypothetical protein SAMN05421841_0619 [Chryseobacterium wanjuense]|jgi:hypothetical protein|uniref:Uncharacterized protein n=1 Tax=Chryseobacterium wanjuense TaxID=356305 RepID=A0A1I0NJJ1_9FLAO|nr:hypothetical protein [Chryseobacterium wanjuense]SEW01333.1 hypothetical protein SAMN05421841_0619 [Chryseobacterium wanjuense]